MLKKNILNFIVYPASLIFSSVAIASAAPEAPGPSNYTNPPASTTTPQDSNFTTSPTSSAPTSSTNTQTKDEWLTKLRGVVPEMICKNFASNATVNKQLTDANIDYAKCVSLIPAMFDKCRDKYYSQLPATIDKENAPIWGKSIGECIGTDFAASHFSSTAPATATATTPASTSTTGSGSSSSTPPQELTKDEWLDKLKTAVPDLICKGFLGDPTLKQRLQQVNINYDKCVTLIPASVDKCRSEFYAQIPATINAETAGKWGHSIGECIGKDFALKHLFNNASNNAADQKEADKQGNTSNQ